MKFSDLQLRVLFQVSYEELLVEKVNEKLKLWGDGLDRALDEMEKEINDERQE